MEIRRRCNFCGSGTGNRTPIPWLRKFCVSSVLLGNPLRSVGRLRGRRTFSRAKFHVFFNVVATLPRTTNVLDLAASNPLKCREDFRNEWPQVWHAIGWSINNHDAKRKNGDVVLVFEFPVHRHESLGDAACALQQITVLGPRPAEALHGGYGMGNQGGDQVVREVLVKQYAHVSAGSRVQDRVPRWPVRVERTEIA